MVFQLIFPSNSKQEWKSLLNRTENGNQSLHISFHLMLENNRLIQRHQWLVPKSVRRTNIRHKISRITEKNMEKNGIACLPLCCSYFHVLLFKWFLSSDCVVHNLWRCWRELWKHFGSFHKNSFFKEKNSFSCDFASGIYAGFMNLCIACVIIYE